MMTVAKAREEEEEEAEETEISTGTKQKWTDLHHQRKELMALHPTKSVFLAKVGITSATIDAEEVEVGAAVVIITEQVAAEDATEIKTTEEEAEMQRPEKSSLDIRRSLIPLFG